MSAAGSVWIDGSELRYVDGNGAEWSYEGEVVAHAVDREGNVLEDFVGTVRVDGNQLKYVDPDGYVRSLTGTVGSDATDGMAGSIWIENSRIALIGAGQRKVLLGDPGAKGGGSDVDIQIEDISVQPTTVSAGESVDLSITYTNVGGSGTDVERVFVGDRLEYENEFEMEAGDSGSVSGTVHTEPEDAGTTELTFELANSGYSETVDLTVVEESASEVDISIEYFETEKDYAAVGEEVTYCGKLTNTGGSGDSRERLYAGDVLIDEWSPSLDAGETQEGSNTITITEEYVGADELRIEFVDSGTAATAELHVVDDETSFDPWILQFEAQSEEVKAGETVDVATNVINLNGAGTEITRVWVGDRIEREHEYDWSADEQAEATTTIETVPEDAGAEEIRLEFVSSGTTESASVSIWDACMRRDAEGLLVDELSAPDQLQVGESVTIDVSFTQCGEDGAATAPSLYFGDSQAWGTLEVVDDGERITGSAELVPQAGEWGDLTVRAESNDDALEQTVQIQPVPFGVDFVQAPAVSEGTLSTTATVSNEGWDVADRQPIELRIDGEVVDETEVELEAFGSTEVSLSGPVSSGEHAVTVASATDEAETTVAVEAPEADVSVALGDVRDPVMHGAEIVKVPATVTNDGSGSATVDVVASAGAGEATATVEVAAGESASVTPQAPAQPDPSQDLAVSVEAVGSGGDALDGASTTVSVAEPLELTLGGEYEPQPVGEDGLYRDVTGDGSIGHTDVVTFFNYQHRSSVKDNGAYFDYTGNGRASHGDVVELFRYVALDGI